MNKNAKEFEKRALNLDGEVPRLRELWTAFYRMYRMCKEGGCYKENAAQLCFYAFAGMFHSNWLIKFMRLVNSTSDIIGLWALKSTNIRLAKEGGGLALAKSMRKKQLIRDRDDRLYGKARHMDQYEKRQALMEQDKVASGILRQEKGMEVTPLQVAEVRRNIINHLKNEAAKRGTILTDDECLEVMLKYKGRYLP